MRRMRLIEWSAVIASLAVTAGCNAILGTEEPIVTGGGGGAAGGGGNTTAGGAGGGAGGAVERCGDNTWAHWDPDDGTPLSASPGIIVDNRTGLEWYAAMAPTPLTYALAEAHCANPSASDSGYRLPTRIELLSILDHSGGGDVLVKPPFMSNPARYWTASQAPGSASARWLVDTAEGTSEAAESSNTLLTAAVQCVREISPPVDVMAADCRYMPGTTNTVIDLATGLEWEKTARTDELSLVDAGMHCVMLTAGASESWVVPSLGRLATLMDESREASPLIADLFNDQLNADGIYWSSSNWHQSGRVFVLNLNGEISTAAVTTDQKGRVRCVRKAP